MAGRAKTSGLEQSQLLMEYTKFHIGIYTAVPAALIAGHEGGIAFINQYPLLTLLSVLCFAAAGLCGGVIASSLPDFSSFEEFRNSPLGVGNWRCMTYPGWAYYEHRFFWSGMGLIVLSYVLQVVCG